MNTAVQDQSATRKNLVVTLDANEVATQHAATVAEFSRHARIPGFRPGKAPADMVAKRFEKDIADEFKQKVVSAAYRAGLESSKLDVLNLVDAKPGKIEKGQPAEVSFSVDIRPEFTLPEYTGIATEVTATEATDAEVEQIVEQMRAERADFKVAERPAQKGDYIKLSYEGKVGDKPILELVPDKQIYGKVPQTWEEVEGSQEGLIPGLGKELAGLKTGDKKDVTVVYPAEFAPAPALAGQTAIYAVEVLEVRERVLPTLDDAFAKAHQADSVDQLKTNVRNNLKLQKEYQNHSAQRRQVIDALVSKAEFDVPGSLVDVETQNILRQFIEENMRRGVPQEQFEKDKKELYENARKSAVGRVRSQLILARIAEKENLRVTENDINAFIYQESTRTGTAADKLVKQLSKDRDQLRSVQQSIIFDKAVEFLVSKATVSTKA
ncbi:MAG TPA: trigger factor [Opitutaceae bacterium]|nr:trigger factor [Opitutaceae bacterium]